MYLDAYGPRKAEKSVASCSVSAYSKIAKTFGYPKHIKKFQGYSDDLLCGNLLLY